MPPDYTPTDVIASWAEDGTNVTFPIASVPELTAEEADAVSGDSRKIAYALMEKFHAWYNALDEADKPAQLTMSRNQYLSGDNIIKDFNVRFVCSPTGVDVADES